MQGLKHEVDTTASNVNRLGSHRRDFITLLGGANLTNPADNNGPSISERDEAAARSIGVKLLVLHAASERDFDAAFTRMAGQPTDEPDSTRPAPGATQMSPDLVAPMVAFLAHEDCPVSGEIYAAGAGRFARIFIASTVGYVHADGAPTIEDVAANWDAINDERGYYLPADLMSWSAAFTAHLRSG